MTSVFILPFECLLKVMCVRLCVFKVVQDLQIKTNSIVAVRSSVKVSIRFTAKFKAILKTKDSNFFFFSFKGQPLFFFIAFSSFRTVWRVILFYSDFGEQNSRLGFDTSTAAEVSRVLGKGPEGRGLTLL